MLPPNDTTNRTLNGNPSQNKDAAEPNVDFLETTKALWIVLVRHVEATVEGFKLDLKLAVYSLMALLVTGIMIAALLVGLWVLGMGLIFVGLTALQVPVVLVLLVIALIHFLLLFICHRFSKRMLNNLHFKTIRAALADTPSLG